MNYIKVEYGVAPQYKMQEACRNCGEAYGKHWQEYRTLEGHLIEEGDHTYFRRGMEFPNYIFRCTRDHWEFEKGVLCDRIHPEGTDYHMVVSCKGEWMSRFNIKPSLYHLLWYLNRTTK